MISLVLEFSEALFSISLRNLSGEECLAKVPIARSAHTHTVVIIFLILRKVAISQMSP